jgi:Fur family ferric uptake transcriptional regulator
MRHPTEGDARQRLAEASLRRTRPRVAVVAALIEADRPLTQDEITSRLGDSAPNKVTIYRALELLVQEGLVHRAFVRDRTWHFELADNCTKRQCHPHFTCSRCGLTTCLRDLQAPSVARRYRGYAIQRQRIELEGLCPDCAA